MSNREGRISPENITELRKNEIFVFSSNESGIHEKGTALLAKQSFGAEEGKGWGPTGNCFALPTRGWGGHGTLPLLAIECYIGRFSEYAMQNSDKKFIVTEIGSENYSAEEIAPLFAGFHDIKNVLLPKSFWNVIDKVYLEDLVKLMMIENGGEKNELQDV